MRREVGILILVGTVVSAAWAGDLGQPREVAQGKAAKTEAKTEAKSESKPAAATSTSSETKTRTKAKAKASPGITPEREAAAKTFVDQHHPELGELLVHLKEHNKKEYDKAVRDLFKTSERLARIHETDVDRYDLELRLWQTQSRIDLLAARHKMSPTNELKAQLKDAIVEQQTLRKSLVELDRDRTKEKLTKLNQQLTSLEKLGDKDVEERLRSLIGVTEKEKADKPANKGAKSK